MKTLNIAEARQNLSALVDEVRFGGETVVIAKYGHPAVMLVNFDESKASKAPNPHPFRGKPFKMSPDFDAPMDDLWEVFDENAGEPLP